MDALLRGLDVRAPSLDTVLLARLEAVAGAPLQPSPQNVRLHFARTVAQLATRQCEALVARAAGGGEARASVAELQMLRLAAEVVVAWWLLPLLLPGVGVPLSRRAKWSRSDRGHEVNCDGRPDLHLLGALNWLRSLLAVPFVQAIVRDQHLSDMCAAYLQLAYAPAGYWQGTGAQRQRVRAAFAALLNAMPVDAVLDALLPLISGSAVPSWLRARATALLVATLKRPHGVAALLSALLDRPDARATHGALDRAATLVVKGLGVGADGCPRFLCAQLVGCFGSTNEAVRRCAAMCVERMLRANGDQTTRDIVSVTLLDPLTVALWQDGDSVSGRGEEQRIDCAVANLCALVLPCANSGAFWDWFRRRCARAILLLACCVRKSVSRLRAPVMQVLESAVRMASGAEHDGNDARAVHAMLRAMVLDEALDEADRARRWQWVLGPTGGAVAALRTPDAARDWESECDTICSVLARAPSGVVGDLFTEAITGAVKLQDIGDGHLTRRVAMARLAMALLDAVPERLLDDAVQVLVMLRALLLSNNASGGDDELLALLLVVLDALLRQGAGRFRRHHETLVSDLLPALTGVHTVSPQLLAQSAELCECIRDPCASWRARDQDDDTDTDSSKAFASALRDMDDALVTVRAHGLVALRKLILARDCLTLANLPALLAALRVALRHNESYVFLGAVQALAALGDVCTRDVVPLLVADFHDASLSEDTRLAIGEAAVLIAQRCGAVLPVHAPLLMDCFLRGVRDDAAAIRASSLSNVGFLCEALHWSLQPYLSEVLAAVVAILRGGNEQDVMVRRAAVLVTALVVRGAGDDAAALLMGTAQRSLVGDVIHLLTMLERDDCDDVVRLHARQALVDLESHSCG